MAGFMFFKDGIKEIQEALKGEVTQGSRAAWTSPNGAGAGSDEWYEGWIELHSITQSVTRAIESGRSGTARARAGTVLEDVQIEKEVDCCSTELIKACSGGYSFDQVYIHLCTSIESDDDEGHPSYHPYLEFLMEQVKVTNYSISCSGLNDGAVPTESLNLNFDTITWTYWPIGPYPVQPELGPNDIGKIRETGWSLIKATSYTPEREPPGTLWTPT